MESEKEIILACLQNNREAQKLLYKTFAAKMHGICYRFAQKNNQAEDILQEGFIRVFKNLGKFKFQGSFEGWVKRIIINAAIDYIKKYGMHFQEINEETTEQCDIVEDEATSNLSVEYLMELIKSLPDSKRVIFNLYAYEGYSHKEIAEKLNITVSTSKSQYCKARKMLQEQLINIKNKSYERVN